MHDAGVYPTRGPQGDANLRRFLSTATMTSDLRPPEPRGPRPGWVVLSHPSSLNQPHPPVRGTPRHFSLCGYRPCWVPEYSGLNRRVRPTFPADGFFSESGTIRDGISSPSRVFQVATLSGQEHYQAAVFGVGWPRPAAAFWPPPRIVHLWPNTRFAVKPRGRSRMVQRPRPDLCWRHRVTDVSTATVWCERNDIGFVVRLPLGGLARIRWNRSVSSYCPERSWASNDAMRSASKRSRFPARTPGEAKEVEWRYPSSVFNDHS